MFAFFNIVANESAGAGVSLEVKVAEAVSGQKLGVIMHAGMLSVVVSVIKYVISL